MAELHLAERLVFSAVLADRPDLFLHARTRLTDAHFLDPNLRTMFLLVERYYDAVGALPTRAIYGAKMAEFGLDAGRTALQLELYDALTAATAQEHEFYWAVGQLGEDFIVRRWADGLDKAKAILTQGITDVDGHLLQGHVASRESAILSLSEIDRDTSLGTAPEGDMRVEVREMWATYLERKRLRLAGQLSGIRLGIPSLDRRIGGFQPGELELIAAYSGDGKTQLCIQLAWSAVVEQGKSVVFFTTETLREQIVRRLIARHSCHPKFGIPDGIDSTDIKDGTLSAEFERKYVEVIWDFTHCPDYGHLYIAQVPRAAAVASLEAHAYRILRHQPIDLIVMDYLALLMPEHRREGTREELSGILKGAKRWATTFNSGAGVPLVSPWQVNRSGRTLAQQLRSYDSTATAETAEATNSADVLISVLAEGDTDTRHKTIVAQILKNRDGVTTQVDLTADYATSRFTDRVAGVTAQQQMNTLVSDLVGVDSVFNPQS